MQRQVIIFVLVALLVMISAASGQQWVPAGPSGPRKGGVRIGMDRLFPRRRITRRNTMDDEEETDAEFFRKLRGVFNKVKGVAQKGMGLYQQYGGMLGLDDEESDAEFFRKLRGVFNKVKGVAQKGMGLYQQYGGMLGLDDIDYEEEADAAQRGRQPRLVPGPAPAPPAWNNNPLYQPPWQNNPLYQPPVAPAVIPRRHTIDDEEETDAEFFRKLRGVFNKVKGVAQKGMGLYQQYGGMLGLDDNLEEADAEFLRNIGGWLKRNITPENIQKGMSIFRTIRGGEDTEESDSEFLDRLRGLVGKAKGLYQQYGSLLRSNF